MGQTVETNLDKVAHFVYCLRQSYRSLRVIWCYVKVTIVWGHSGSPDDLSFVQLLCFEWFTAGSGVAQHVLRVHPLPSNISLTGVLVLTLWWKWALGHSLSVSGSMIQPTWLQSALARMLTFEPAQTCENTLFTFLLLFFATFIFTTTVLLFEPYKIYMCAMSLWLHLDILHSFKGCPSFQSARYVEGLSFWRKRWGKEQDSCQWCRK